jgi:hypothetical protein
MCKLKKKTFIRKPRIKKTVLFVCNLLSFAIIDFCVALMVFFLFLSALTSSV